MPRVHGIDIVPRRGRGRGRGGRRSFPPPAAAGGSGENGGIASATAPLGLGAEEKESPLANFSMSLESPSPTKAVEEIDGAAGRMSLEGERGGDNNDWKSAAAEPPAESHAATLAPGNANAEGAAGATIANQPSASIASPPSLKTAAILSTNETGIRPMARESLDKLAFGHSFSVPEIHRRAPPPNSFRAGNAEVGGEGLAPSLEGAGNVASLGNHAEEPGKATAAAAAAAGEGHDELMAPPGGEVKTVKATSPPAEEDGDSSEEEEEPLQSQPLLSPDPPERPAAAPEALQQMDVEEQASIDAAPAEPKEGATNATTATTGDATPHAQWLYRRCAAACLRMETSRTPLELAAATLRTVRALDDDDDDDAFEERLRQRLFAATSVGKRRDLDFVFEVVGRAAALRGDGGLDEGSLRAAAAGESGGGGCEQNCGRGDDEGESDDRLQTQPADLTDARDSPEKELLATQPEEMNGEKTDAGSDDVSPTKKYRSRRKKRPANNTGVDGATKADETGALQAQLSPKEGEKGTTQTNAANDEMPVDFPVENDGLNMQDDEKWSFLPADQSQTANDAVEEEENASPRRVTRSMGPPEGADEEADGDGEDEADEAVEERIAKMIDGNEAAEQGDGDENGDKALEEDDTSPGVVNTPRGPEENEEVHAMVKTRKRGESKGTVRVMFTGITATSKHMRMIDTIGAEFVGSIEEAHTATHVIASGGRTKLRRTPKLMVCICRVPNILSYEWLEQSAKEQRILDTDAFLLLGDREAEKRYDFNMKETIQNGIVARKRRGGVLGGWFVYICSGVAGNKAPSLKELHLIVNAAGGQILKSLTNQRSFDPLKTIMLTSDPCTAAQRKEAGVAKAERLGAKALSTSWLFHTIITQNLFGIDIDDSGEGDGDSVSVLTTSPVKRSATDAARHHSAPADDASVRSSATRGSRVSHLERATYSPSKSKLQKQKLTFEQPAQPPSSHSCATTREQFLSLYQSVLATADGSSAAQDEAASQTHGLWMQYFGTQSAQAKPKSGKKKKRGVRCLRGRNRSISPLVSSTTPKVAAKTSGSSFSATSRKLLVEDNAYVSFEAYVLFTLANRSQDLESSAAKSVDAFFPQPTSINSDGHAKQEGARSKQLALAVNNDACEVFGTLQDVFSLHQQHQSSGMIPEQVIATLAIQAIEAVSAIHLLGVVHNDIGLDSFLVVRRASNKKKRRKGGDDESSSWFLQLVGFGYQSLVLTCEEQCQEAHYEHDYQCLANVIHILLTGGVDIYLNAPADGSVEFVAKPLIKGNLFLRGSLSWCSLIDALMCAGDLAPACKRKCAPFKVQYPINLLDVAASEDDGDSRMQSFVWSYRVLQELSSSDDLVEFLEDLSAHNSRYIFEDINLASFSCSADAGRQSFACYTSKEGATDQLMKKESQLQVDTLALAQRETELQQKVVRLERSKAEHKSMLARESEVQARERMLVQREQAHLLDVERLAKTRRELRQKEKRFEERLRVLRDAERLGQSEYQALSLRKGEEAPSSQESRSQNSQGSRKRPHGNGSKPPTPRHSQSSLAVGEPSQGTSSQNQNGTKFAAPPPEMANEAESFLSPRTSSKKRKSSNPMYSPLMVTSHAEAALHNGESQESQESSGSAKRRKTGSARKSPKCSLHNLPKSPQRNQPKKVFVTLGDEEDSDEC